MPPTKEQVMSDGTFTVPGAPYSQAIRVTGGTLLFVAGQVSRDLATGEIVPKGDVEAQARQALSGLKSVLEAAGGTMSDIVQLRCYYKNVEYVPTVTKVRWEYFSQPPFPAVTGIVCDFTRPDMLVEFDAIAVL